MRMILTAITVAALLAGRGPAFAQGAAAEWPALIRRYEAHVAQSPADYAARFTLAMLYARDGRLLDGYKQLLEADQAAGPARRLAIAGQIARDAESRIRQEPRDLLARYRLAFARYFLNDYAGSAAEFARITAAEPRNDWGFGYLGQALVAAKQEERAIEAWQRGLAVNPNNAVLHYMLGLMYAKRDDKKKAAFHFAAAYRDRTLYDYLSGNRR